MRRWMLVFVLLLAPVAFGQADQAILSVTDSPDPVIPGNNVTYTVQIQNNGPNPAVNGGINISFPGMNWVSGSGPAGFTCFVVGQNASCINPSWAPGAATLTIVLQMPPHLVSFADGSTTVGFSTSGTTPDPVGGNNNDSETTSWDSPQIDMAVTASDSPDPVTPDNNITYTVNVVNNGPDVATSAQFSMINSDGLRFQSAVVPAGWSCTLPAVNAFPNFNCTKPTMAAAETGQFVIVVRAAQEAIGINDTTVQSGFQINATGQETNHGNNLEYESTAYVAPDADLGITATDSPDPVTPNNDITYTITATNAGPDTATGNTVNFVNSGNLDFRSLSAPAGWSCTPPAVDAAPNFSCTNASFANGAMAVFTLVVRATTENVGINDGTVGMVFTIGSSNAKDPNNGNNVENETTAYVTPDADMGVSVTDSPDPVAPDGTLTFTATVTNAGPDAAPNASFSVYNNGSLRFQSLSVPAGWNCTPPAVEATPTFSCTNPSFAVGATSIFTLVVRAEADDLGINDGTLFTTFSAGSSIADPNNANNVESEQTAYATPDANVQITASDAPDPVTNGNLLTYTVNAANAGPDPAPNAGVTFATHPSLTFQSLSAPAGWSCTTPAVNSTGVISCTNASFPSGGAASFTLVMKVVTSGSGGVLNSVFTISSGAQDPVPANNSIEVFTNWVGQTSDLAITKSTLSTAAAQGSTITYTLSSSNAGPDAASNVTVTDVLPIQLLFQSISAPAGWSCTTPAVGANGTVTCTIASFANGATANFTLVTTVAPNATGTINNNATIGGSGSDPNPGNGSGASPATAVAGNSDLGVTKTTTANNIPPGGAISYTINVNNGGPDPAASVVMTDTLPATLLFQSLSAPAGWSCTTPAVGATGTITCTAATLAAGATATFTLNVTVASGASGFVTNTANVSHSGPDANPVNSSGTSPQTQIAPPPTTADLSITKTTAATTLAQGQTFSYTIAVANAGPDAATSVVMNDVLPASLQFVSLAAPAGWSCTTPAVNTNGAVNCTAATLASGATASFTLTVRVTSTATGSVSNTATTSSATNDSDSGDTTATTTPIVITTVTADVSIVKNTIATTLTPGQTFSYNIAVSNAGPNAASSVVMNDVLPAALLFQSISAPAGWNCTMPPVGSTGTVTCATATLASGTTANFTLTVRVANGTTGVVTTNTATVNTTTNDPDPTDNSATTPPNAVGPPQADVSVVKSNGASFAVTGTSFTYTINVANAGPSPAANVVVTDVIPAGLTFVSATPSQGSCSGTTTITCNLGTLNAAASATITISTTVTATSGTVSNTAVVTSTTADPDPTDNSSTTPSVPVTATVASDIPTLSEWALIGLAMLLGLAAVVRVKM